MCVWTAYWVTLFLYTLAQTSFAKASLTSDFKSKYFASKIDPKLCKCRFLKTSEGQVVQGLGVCLVLFQEPS